MTTQILEKEAGYYKKILPSLAGDYPDGDHYALIIGESSYGVFDSYENAVFAGYQKVGNVSFLVKQIQCNVKKRHRL